MAQAAAAAAAEEDEVLLVMRRDNRLLNLLDPPKDLAVDGALTKGTHGPRLRAFLTQLFWPTGSGDLPADFTAVGDTKNIMKRLFGSTKEGAPAGTYTDYLLNKSNKMRILREKQNTGSDGRPSGMYISQDSGPGVEKLVKNARIIITPGTIMDPASKTKTNAHDYTVTNLVDAGRYLSLPNIYIKQLNMDNIITGAITITLEGGNYRVNIPYRFKRPGVADTEGSISALLDHTTFKKARGDTGGGDYFQGNDTKNTFIASNLNKDAEIDTIKKYILVKELGDTLQVSWLKYIIKQSDEAVGTANAAANPYTTKLTALVTGDTVVWYRSIINKVPVILTYMGETNYWGANENELVMIQAFKKTIREQLITDNQSVIDMINELIAFPRYMEEGQERWLWGMPWSSQAYTAALEYLRLLVERLENLNKDALIYIDNVPTIDAAKSAAERYHFANPFVKKKTGPGANQVEWKTNNKVFSFLSDGSLKFHASSFKNPGKLTTNLQKGALFVQLSTAGGGQRGGARKSLAEKIAQANDFKTYFKARIDEFKEGGTVTLTGDYQREWTVIRNRADSVRIVRNRIINGDAGDFSNDAEAWSFYSNNSETSHGGGTFFPKNFVLYLLVRDFFPEVFSYAAVMKKGIQELTRYWHEGEIQTLWTESVPWLLSRPAQFLGYLVDTTRTTVEPYIYDPRGDYVAMLEKFPAVSIDLKTKYPLDYLQNLNGELIINHGKTGAAIQLYANEILEATKQAIYLANEYISYFKHMPTQELANFLRYALDNRRIFSEGDLNRYSITLQPENYVLIPPADQAQYGGGEDLALEPVFTNAMDIYDIYYSLYVKTAYEDRIVTDDEFEKVLYQNKATRYMLALQSILLDMKEAKTNAVRTTPLKSNSARVKKPNTSSPQFDPFALAKLMRGSPMTGMSAEERASVSPLLSGSQYSNFSSNASYGGKRKYRKTQKKRKSSKKQRKTRRHKK